MPSRVLVLLLSVFLVTKPVWAGEARREIEAAYQKSYRAAALKHLPGMLSMRDESFEGYSQDGTLVDPEKERESLRGVLQASLSVAESGTILNYLSNEHDRVECIVEDRFKSTFIDANSKNLTTVIFVTRSRDTWVKRRTGWKQVRCRVLSKQTEFEPPSE
jgi:hypothetical protein